MTMRQKRARASRGRRPRLPFPVFLLAVCAAVTVGTTTVRALAAGGHAPQVLSGTAERLMAFLDYFAGVFTLLSLTAAVLGGLAATDRLVLTPRLRVAAQSVHRATSVAALGFLGTHIAVKVAERDARPLAVLLPFGGGATLAVGLGTLAADLLVLAAATGAVRGRFADSRRPGMWRVLHASAYACWPIALAHGLTAGRAAAVWVLWSYGACGALVGLALLVRALGALDRGAAKVPTLRAYAARRPSRAALAELRALSREQEPVPYAARATAGGTAGAGVRSGARVAATSGAHDAARPAPDRAREHPRLADTPPHGVPVQAVQFPAFPARAAEDPAVQIPPVHRRGVPGHGGQVRRSASHRRDSAGAPTRRARHAASPREAWPTTAPRQAPLRQPTPSTGAARHGRSWDGHDEGRDRAGEGFAGWGAPARDAARGSSTRGGAA